MAIGHGLSAIMLNGSSSRWLAALRSFSSVAVDVVAEAVLASTSAFTCVVLLATEDESGADAMALLAAAAPRRFFAFGEASRCTSSLFAASTLLLTAAPLVVAVPASSGL